MSAPSWIGKTLGGRYQIEALLGQGGMSAVYKGNDPNLRRVVAIKLIHSHLSSDVRFVHRFGEEAAAVAKLRHPNIIQVYDFNNDDGTYYMVMEFIPGETLQDRLRRYSKAGRSLPFSKAIQYTINICAAIDYAHKRGMIHRDIKPANIMLDVNDQGILMDFGIVKMVGSEQFTATGAVVGTALYLAPELIRGETPDPRSDIYALGVTLFEMVAGKPPFEASSAMTLMMMHLNDPVPDLSQLRPDTPMALAAIIQRALAKNLNERFSSAEEMGRALQAILPGILNQESTRESTGVHQANEAEKTITDAPAPASPATQADKPGPPTEAEQAPSHATQIDPDPLGYPQASFSSITDPELQKVNVPPRRSETPTSPRREKAAVQPAARQQAAQARPPTGANRQSAQPAAQAPAAKPFPIALVAVVVIMLVVGALGILAIGGYALSQLFAGGAVTPTLNVLQATEDAGGVLLDATPTATRTVRPTATRTLAPTRTPSATPTPTITNTPTPDLFVLINAIHVDSSNRYVVDYETFGYTETLPGMHVHFFFNTVTPENAGSPGSGPWILYGGPRPFTGYRVGDRPSQATQMCALVANANHSIILNSGTCIQLP